jgi:hypothetical protein
VDLKNNRNYDLLLFEMARLLWRRAEIGGGGERRWNALVVRDWAALRSGWRGWGGASAIRDRMGVVEYDIKRRFILINQ